MGGAAETQKRAMIPAPAPLVSIKAFARGHAIHYDPASLEALGEHANAMALTSLSRQPDLAVLMAEIGTGGMGKMRLQLMNAIARRDYRVDLLLASQEGRHRLALDERIRVIALPTTHAVFGILPLARYLWRNRPRALLTQRIRVNVLAHRARRLARVATRIYATGNTHQSTALDAFPEPKRTRRRQRVERYFARNDGMIAISQGVAEDYAALMGWPLEAIAVAPNPVVTPAMAEQAGAPVEHPWFAQGEPPVVLAMGRLEKQKDFATLLAAFARFREAHEARLVILGDGPLRTQIEAQAGDLGIDRHVDLPGFVANPYAWLARSRMFVLSSRWEGLGNVLIEAMAVGTPVVATDCPSGPAEILEQGALGPLVACRDPQGLADGMAQIWTDPPAAEALRHSAYRRFSAEGSAEAYLGAMGLLDRASV